MKIEELKKELSLSNKDIASFFDLTPMAYANSSAKKRYEQAIFRFYAFVKSKVGGQKENKTCAYVDLKNEQPLNLQNVINWALENEHIESDYSIKELNEMYECRGEESGLEPEAWSGGFADNH